MPAPVLAFVTRDDEVFLQAAASAARAARVLVNASTTRR